MVQWQGYKALMERHPSVEEVIADLVHKTDQYEFDPLTKKLLPEYDPYDEKRTFQSVDDIRGGYVVAKLINGKEKWHHVPAERIRKAQACAQTQNVWKSWYYQMALKTLYRDAFARRAVPLDPLLAGRLRKATQIDDEALKNDPSRVVDAVKHTPTRRVRRATPISPESTPTEGQQDKSPTAASQPPPKASEQPEATDTPEPDERPPEAKPEPQRRAKRLKKLPVDARKKLSELTTVAEVDDWESWWTQEVEEGAAVEKLAAEHRELVRSQPAADASESGELFP